MQKELWNSHIRLCALELTKGLSVELYGSPLWLSYRKQGRSLLHLDNLSHKIFIMPISIECTLYTPLNYGDLFMLTTECTDILSKGRKLRPITRKLYQSFCNW